MEFASLRGLRRKVYQRMSERGTVRIIGGGMTGLTLALRLARRGIPVVVHERDPYLGGLASESTLNGIPVERFYHCILPTDYSLIKLLGELGLADEIGWNKTRTGFFTDSRLMEMTTSADFLRFPALTLLDRLRLGWTIAYCSMNRSWKRLDRESVGPFLIRHGGRRLFESIWEPLLLAKLGPEYNRFAASFIWATVVRMLSARSAKGRSEKLGFVQGRYGKVFGALRKAIEAAGGEVRVGQVVTGLDRTGNGHRSRWVVQCNDESLPASGVVLCVPAPLAVQWLNGMNLAFEGSLREVDYLGVVCEALLLKRSLTPYYVLNLTDRSLPFTGVIETSNLAGTEEFGGFHLVYLPRYRDQQSPIWKRTDESIHQESLEGVKAIMPDFREQDVTAWAVHRARYVQPVHPVGWGDRIPPVRLAPGLAYLSTAQIHPWPVFNDEAIRNVDARVDEVIEVLKPGNNG